MRRKLTTRILPILLLQEDQLVKTIRFKKPTYIGDPINAVKIFNEKEVDEIVLLDITASLKNKEPNYSKIEEICSEAFMPFAYGGGVKSLDQIDRLFKLGIEKVILSSVLNEDLGLVKEAVVKYGSQSIIACVDLKRNLLGKIKVYTHSGSKPVSMNYDSYIQNVVEAGVGELILNFIHKDGTYEGYDLSLIEKLANKIDIPLVACGGARDLDSFKQAIQAGASAIAAGSLFVFRGTGSKGILINYPNQDELEQQVFS